MSILTRDKPISIKDLKEAISLKCANCYCALAMANALGGYETDAWHLCHNHSLEELLKEAEAQSIDLSDLLSAVEKKPVKETLYYKRVAKLISEEEFQTLFHRWKNGKDV